MIRITRKVLCCLSLVLLFNNTVLATGSSFLNPPWENHFFTGVNAIASGKNCSNIYEEDPKSPKGSAAIFTCALMMCGHHEFYDRPECDFFRRLSHQENFRSDFQGIKEYLALIELEKAKYEAVNSFQKSSFMPKQIFTGIKMDLLDSMTVDILNKNDSFFLENNFLAETAKTGELFFIKSMLSSYCSKVEADNGFCEQKLGDKPYHLLSGSLLDKETLFNADEIKGAKQYISNVTSPIPIALQKRDNIFIDTKKATNSKSPEYILSSSGKRHLRNKMLLQMLTSISQESLRRIYTDRLQAKYNNSELPQGVSLYDSISGKNATLETESKWRFLDPNWYSEIEKMTDSALIRELNSMQSVNQIINFNTMQQLESIEMYFAMEMIFLFERTEQLNQENNKQLAPQEIMDKIKGQIRRAF